MCPEPFAQRALEDFSGAGLRQLEVGELDATWNLVTGQRSTAVRDQLVHTENDAGFQHDTRHDQFAPLGIGYAEHRGLANGGVFVEDGLDLAGIDVLAARDDHVLHAVQDVQIPFRILITDVAGSKQPVAERAQRLFAIIPVTAHDVGAARNHFAGLPNAHLRSGLVHDAHIDARAWTPARQQALRRVLIVLESREKARLAQPVDLNQSEIRKYGPRAMNNLGRDGRAPVPELLQALEVIARQFRELRQQVDHRRDEHGIAHTFALYRLAERVRTELRYRDLTCAKGGRRKHEREVGDVKQRCCVQVHTALVV